MEFITTPIAIVVVVAVIIGFAVLLFKGMERFVN